MILAFFFSLYCYVLAKTSYFCNIIMKLGKVIEPIRKRNGENGYSILKARVKGMTTSLPWSATCSMPLLYS